jgi:hypothetical protein
MVVTIEITNAQMESTFEESLSKLKRVFGFAFKCSSSFAILRRTGLGSL